jgi:uncharacterized protein (TIGR02145 family)
MKSFSTTISRALAITFCIISILSSCKEKDTLTDESSLVVEYDSITDTRDSHVYKTVKIGDQTWLAENLAYLPQLNIPFDTSKTSPRYYVYDFKLKDTTAAKETENYKKYGVLYNWPAAIKACPTGWHLPSEKEWNTLIDKLGGSYFAGNRLKSTTEWISSTTENTNISGFSALPSGYANGGYFYYIGTYCAWWCSTEVSVTESKIIAVYNNSSSIGAKTEHIGSGYPIRCIKD